MLEKQLFVSIERNGFSEGSVDILVLFIYKSGFLFWIPFSLYHPMGRNPFVHS